VKLLALAAALVTLAFPAVSVAGPSEPVRPANIPPGVPAQLPAHMPTIGTDVAAPDQQSPVVPAQPAADDGGFDWSNAGIGAGGALVVLAGSLAAALTLRRRSLPG
jgi:hypothetical protein